MTFGHPHRHFASTDSTNSRARELAAAGAPDGTVVTAAEQTAGRGRQGRTWTAPPDKALLYSAIVRPLKEHHKLLPLAAPLAVCAAAEALQPDLSCKVKWPNDILVGGKKLAGVLIEARPQDGWAVIGVGLNLTISEDEFPPELRNRATSVFEPGYGNPTPPPADPSERRRHFPTSSPDTGRTGRGTGAIGHSSPTPASPRHREPGRGSAGHSPLLSAGPPPPARR